MWGGSWVKQHETRGVSERQSQVGNLGFVSKCLCKQRPRSLDDTIKPNSFQQQSNSKEGPMLLLDVLKIKLSKGQWFWYHFQFYELRLLPVIR